VEWDSFADYGVTHILFALGINDINLAELPLIDKSVIPTTLDYRKGCEALVSKAHARGIQVIAYTIYPATTQGTPKNMNKEFARREFNEVIRSGIFDGILDIEGLMKDPAVPYGYKAGYCVSDGVHLTDTGGRALADGLCQDSIKQLFGIR